MPQENGMAGFCSLFVALWEEHGICFTRRPRVRGTSHERATGGEITRFLDGIAFHKDSRFCFCKILVTTARLGRHEKGHDGRCIPSTTCGDRRGGGHDDGLI